MRLSGWHPWKDKLLFADGSCLSSLSQVLLQVIPRLKQFSQTATLDSQVLLAHVLGKTRSWVLAHPEEILTDDQEIKLDAALGRLSAGEPLPYVLGHWEFYGLDFLVSPVTLIPRPETELMVEKALGWLESHPDDLLALDLGTGTGCIAVALAANVPNLHVIACDISIAALRIAIQNVIRHSLSLRVNCLQADLIPKISRKVNVICANLPYVPTEILHSLPVSRNEPRLALDGGSDGLSYIRSLLSVAPGVMASESLLLIELEATQGPEVCALAETAFPKAWISLLKDLAGHDRLVCVSRS